MQRKAPNLSKAKRVKIGKYKEANPNASYVEIANLLNVTYDQARSAHHDYKAGKLTRKIPKAKSAGFVYDKNADPTSIYTDLINQTIQEIYQSKDMDVGERVMLLEKITNIRKNLQAVALESHIKRFDVGLIANIMRRLNPALTDEDILLIYKEEFEKWSKALK